MAVLAIGIFALPGTIAMFGGQHNWYDLGPGGNDVPCEKCHADVYDEMSNSGPHANMSCWYCHRTGNLTGYTYASGDGAGSTSGQEAHAASTVECMDCHEGFVEAAYDNCLGCHAGPWKPTELHPAEWAGGGISDPDPTCTDCHGPDSLTQHWNSGNPSTTVDIGLEAGGFNLTVTSNDTGSQAAHLAFVQDANNSGLMKGANEACITCHTHVAIDINWSHKYKMSLDADESGGSWTVDNFFTEGTYNVTTYGNMSGETTGVTDPIIEIEPEPIGYDQENP